MTARLSWRINDFGAGQAHLASRSSAANAEGLAISPIMGGNPKVYAAAFCLWDGGPSHVEAFMLATTQQSAVPR
jgi:hypothetical protein